MGCPGCLRVVEERADDYFIDVFTCRECLEGGPNGAGAKGSTGAG
jgi:hypothetical protein